MSANHVKIWPDGREVLRCECGLIQFKSAAGRCVKTICKKPYITPKPPETEPQDARIAKVNTPPIAEYHPDEKALSHVGRTLPVMFRAIRQAEGLSQRTLADLMGVPRTWVSKIEMGKVTPRMDCFERTCKALGITMQGIIFLCEHAA